jgi:hypothetical protein
MSTMHFDSKALERFRIGPRTSRHRDYWWHAAPTGSTLPCRPSAAATQKSVIAGLNTPSPSYPAASATARSTPRTKSTALFLPMVGQWPGTRRCPEATFDEGDVMAEGRLMTVPQLLDDDAASDRDDAGVGPVGDIDEDIDKLRGCLGRAEGQRRGRRGHVWNSGRVWNGGSLGAERQIEHCGSFDRRSCRASRLTLSLYARHRESAGT